MRGDIAAHEVPGAACGNWLFQAAVRLGSINLMAGGQDSKLYSSLACSGHLTKGRAFSAVIFSFRR